MIAAQQEAAERAKRKQKQSKATLQEEAAQLAHEVLQAPAGFEQFSARLLKLLKSHGVEWPTVTIEYRGVNVTTQVAAAGQVVLCWRSAAEPSATPFCCAGTGWQCRHTYSG